jgi:hypothetical protein
VKTWRTVALELALERAVAITTGRRYTLLSSLCPATSRTTFRRKCWCRELLMRPSAISKLLAHPSRKQTWSKATPASVKSRRRCSLYTTGCCATRCCVCDKSLRLNLTPLHLPEQMLFRAKVNTLPLALSCVFRCAGGAREGSVHTHLALHRLLANDQNLKQAH